MEQEEAKASPETDLSLPPQSESMQEWKDKYIRTLAEMENMRKRMQKERHEMAKFGVENVVGEFLPSIDNLENALRFAAGAGPEVKSWAMGFEMILSQFKEVLHNHGIVAFHSEGNVFDPDTHEAVEIVETSDHPDGTILQEFSKGYKSSNRTIRPARVKVAKTPHRPKADQVADLIAEEEQMTQN